MPERTSASKTNKSEKKRKSPVQEPAPVSKRKSKIVKPVDPADQDPLPQPPPTPTPSESVSQPEPEPQPEKVSLPQEEPPGKSRTIQINALQTKKYIGNSISTAKYSVISFIPSFLFEQFRRYSNIFFVGISLLQQIPDVSPTGRFTTLVPLLVILCVSAVKEIIEDIKRHRADSANNKREVEVLRDNTWSWVKWSSVQVGDFVKVRNDTFFPADLVLFSSSEALGVCYIETSNLDGETNLKIRQSIPETANFIETDDLSKLSGFLECELPNRNLYEFVGRLKFENEEDVALGPDQILLRGSKLQNTDFIHGFVVYTGHETKLMKNSTVPPLKRSTVDKRTNSQILMLFLLLIIVSLTSASFSVFYSPHDELSQYVQQEFQGIKQASSLDTMHEFLYTFLTFLILYNNLIPISLTVSLEVVRFIQALFINWDYDMFDQQSETHAMARTSNLNEELGEVKYVFSDKTGTLTRNIMEFKACSVNGKVYTMDDLTNGGNNLVEDMVKDHEPDIREFLVLLAVCHTVIPDYSHGGGIENVVYHAASPDERALVYAAMKVGFAFVSRTPNQVVINVLGHEEKYDIINILEFSSARKRMSVVLRGPDGKLKLLCKGADMMIMDRLETSSNQARMEINNKTNEHLTGFSKQGLRTLCCAVRELPQNLHKEWEKTFHKAATAIQDRERKMDEAAEEIEKELRLVGATAIEDKLQDQVPETIADLLEAGINVWVLTGDKQETAINIGYSCQLLKDDMELILVNRDSQSKTRDFIEEYQSKMQSNSNNCNYAIIIDGKTLKFALHEDLRRDFLSLCCICKAVIVCRASPIQKAEIVEYVTHLTGAITLAIGDGANDVAMIQKAHIGIGISGVEGLQAACSSDYAIAQFRFLKKLLFVHGAWNYDRMCKLIFYSFYKNICLYIIELWFAIYSAWSGQIIFERWTIGLYNVLFTCAQPLAIGLFERNCSQNLRMRYPILYLPSENSFSLKMFFAWILNAILHSVTIFWLTWFLYGNGVVWGGLEGGYLVLGNFIFTYVVVVVSLKSGLITKSWTVFTHISIWGSIILWIAFLMVYSYICGIHISWLTIGADICGIGYMVFTSPVFWIGFIIVPVTTLLPDLVLKAIETTIFQGLDDAFRECEVLKKDPDQMLKNREKKKSNENDIFKNCLTCDNFSILGKFSCCCRKKPSPTHPESFPVEAANKASVDSDNFTSIKEVRVNSGISGVSSDLPFAASELSYASSALFPDVNVKAEEGKKNVPKMRKSNATVKSKKKVGNEDQK